MQGYIRALVIRLLLCSVALCRGEFASAIRERIPIILDTDLGSEIDDAFALALALISPEIDLRGVTTVSGDTQIRAMMVCRFWTAVDRQDIPVAR